MMPNMTTLQTVLKTITRSKPESRSAEDLRGDRAKIDLDQLRARVTKIEAERRGLLLRATDAELKANREEAEEARLAVERGEALVEELDRQIAAAEAREAEGAREARAAAAQAAKVKLDKIYATIEHLTVQISGLLEDAKAPCRTLGQWNATADKHFPERRIAYKDATTIKSRLVGAF